MTKFEAYGYLELTTVLGNTAYIYYNEISEVMKQSKGPGTLIATRSGHEYRVMNTPEDILNRIIEARNNYRG